MRRKWVKAMEMFDFKDPYLYLQYSQLLINDNEYRKAVDILKKVIQSRPDDHYLILKAARICRLAGFLEEAEDLYRKLVLVNPVSWNDLVTRWISRDKSSRQSRISSFYGRRRRKRRFSKPLWFQTFDQFQFCTPKRERREKKFSESQYLK